MSAEPEEEADCLIGEYHFVIPVTIIFASEDDEDEEADGDEDNNFIKKKRRGRHPHRKETRGKSSEGTEDRGDGGTGIAGVMRVDDKDPWLNGDNDDESCGKTPPSQPPPGCGRRLYPSNRSGSADEGGGRTTLHPSGKPSPLKPDSRSIKSEPGVTNGQERGSPAQGGQEFTCEECHYSTNNSYNLACHARTHTGERPYACARCALPFRTRSGLNRHTKARVCQRGVPDMGLKPEGGARRRPGAEPRVLECADCDYSTVNAYNLKVHRRVHSDERPYKCPCCDFYFRTQSHLYRHERCHRQQMG